MPFAIGADVGPYKLVEQLGQGGMATVFKAYHPNLDRYVAIKALHPAFAEDDTFLARFQREARVVAKLEHPNIVPIYDYSQLENRPYLVMKYIEGETLKNRISRGPIPVTESIQLIEVIGSALDYAHKKGVLHRDIKPSNVLISDDGQVYLSDFGLARMAQSSEKTLTTDMMIGTPQYISPEQALARQDLDSRTDIYSLGVMIYELLVGKVPFNADTPFAIVHDHIYTPLPLPRSINPEISNALQNVLQKALAKEKEDRYADVISLVNAIKSAASSLDSGSTVKHKQKAPPNINSHQPHKQTKADTIVASKKSPNGKKKKNLLWLWAGGGVITIGIIITFLMIQYVIPGFPNQGSIEPSPVLTEEVVVVPIPTENPVLEINPTRTAPQKKPLEDFPFTMNAVQQQAWLLLKKGSSNLESGAVLQAVGNLDRMQKVAGDDAYFYENAGDELAKQEKWGLAAYIYLNLVRIEGDDLNVEKYDKIAQSIYKASKDPQSELIFNNQFDERPFFQISKARFELFNGDPVKTVEILNTLSLDEEIDQNFPQVHLVEAEYFIYQDHLSEARLVLQNLLDRNDLADWIISEANYLIESNNLE